jgi:hypothetical protein
MSGSICFHVCLMVPLRKTVEVTPMVVTAFTYMAASTTTITGKFRQQRKSKTEKHQKSVLFPSFLCHKRLGFISFYSDLVVHSFWTKVANLPARVRSSLQHKKIRDLGLLSDILVVNYACLRFIRMNYT